MEEETTRVNSTRKSVPGQSQRIRPSQPSIHHEEGCPKRESSKKSVPEVKPTMRKQVPFYLKRERSKPKQTLQGFSSSSTIDVRGQGPAPPEFNSQRASSAKSSSSSMRSSSSISNIFSDFGREMQRKFASRPKSVDQTHFSTSRPSSSKSHTAFGSTVQNSRRNFDPSTNGFATSRSLANTSRSMSTLNILDIDDIPSDIPAPIQTQPAFGLGIYLDESEITIGTFTSGIAKAEVSVRRKAEISFLDDEISIGKNTTTASFVIYDLIKAAPKAKHSFLWRSESFTFSSEEILGIFFEKLVEEMQASKETSAAVDSVVLTPSFFVTSLEKERLKQSFKIAGVNNVRILSSLVTSVVGHAHDINYYVSNTEVTKLIFVVHSSVNSFSMAVVQLSPHSIATKCCIGSENLDECKEDSFETGHARMFSEDVNASLSPEQEASVWFAYEGGVHQLLKGIPESKISKIIGITRSWNESKLRHILERIFGDKEAAVTSSEGLLSGASLLAEAKSLPQDIQVHDASRTNLILRSGSKKWRLECKNRKYVPGNVFTLDIPVPAQGTNLILCEEFSRGKLSNPIGQYKIVASMQPHMKNYDVLVRCFVSVDQDGIFTIGPHFSKEVAIKSFLRTDTLAGDISLEIRRLKVGYENVNYKRKSMLVRQETPPEARQEEMGREDVKIWANDAERMYIDTLSRCSFQGKTAEELKEEHEKVKTETLRRFQTNCESNGVDPSTWMAEVEMKLESAFLDIKDFLTSSKTKFKDWFNKKFPKAKTTQATEVCVEEARGGSQPEGTADDMAVYKSNQSAPESDTDKNNNPYENEYDSV